jgi:AbrB family looped-hinge helix DNA binding protein
VILGTLRKIDSNGRIQLPFDIREKLRIDGDSTLNVYVDNNKIIIEVLKEEVEC